MRPRSSPPPRPSRARFARFAWALGSLGLVVFARAQSTYTVTSTADTGEAGTLRWAIAQANANPGSTINLQNNLGTIAYTSQSPLITAPVTINACGSRALS